MLLKYVDQTEIVAVAEAAKVARGFLLLSACR